MFSAEQFTFDRDRNVALAHYMDEQEVIHEEEEPGEELTQHRVSHDPARPTLSEIDEGEQPGQLSSHLGMWVWLFGLKKIVLF